mgnify:CR=1 FL=1
MRVDGKHVMNGFFFSQLNDIQNDNLTETYMFSIE